MPDRAPRQELLQLGEMLQAMMQDLEIESIAEIVAETAIASADTTTDDRRRAVLLWYGKQFRKLALGPPDTIGPAAPRPHGRAALVLAFTRLALRANRMSTSRTLPIDDLEWVDAFTRRLQLLATEFGL
jgi:hypothetical protein